ncbi:type II toxin-antitoxin system death-on-curing family toxin [Rhodococcus sp. NPDC055024]
MTVFLDVETVLAINSQHGGPGAGVRDAEGIKAAVARPMSGTIDQEFFPSIWEKAAVYLHGLSSTQYFHDGNKRTAWLAAVTFLNLNGKALPPVPEVEAEAFILCVAKDLFSNEDEPDRTIECAAEWFESQYLSKQAGPAISRQVIYAVLAEASKLGNASGVDVMGLDVSALTAPEIPLTVAFTCIMKYQWTAQDGGRPHTFGVCIYSDTQDLPRTEQITEVPVAVPVRRERAPDPDRLLPSLIVHDVVATFETLGLHTIEFLIDGTTVATRPLNLVPA